MEEMQIATIGSFCMNELCEEYRKVGRGNMIKNGKTGTGIQRYMCKICKKSFTETKGTMFYRCRHTEEEIAECMAMVGGRNSLAAMNMQQDTLNNLIGDTQSQIDLGEILWVELDFKQGSAVVESLNSCIED